MSFLPSDRLPRHLSPDPLRLTYPSHVTQVYAIGIPLLYAFILWTKRHLLNPALAAAARVEQERQTEEGKEDDHDIEGVDQSITDGQRKKGLSLLEEEELKKMVKLRRTNPELVPSMFLWKDFGEKLFSFIYRTARRPSCHLF